MSASHDRKFFDTFMLVLGILVGITVALIILARLISSNTAEVTRQTDPALQQEVAARIAPVARVAVAGKDNSALAPAAAPAAAAPAPGGAEAAPAAAAVADLDGETVYNQACVACHGAGVAGAPKFGDKGAWGPRIAQGADTLRKHAIEGFQGKNGLMPAKGGRADLSDQSVINAVDYMAAAGK